MKRKTRFLTHAALLAALYVALTHGQNLLFPGSTSWAIQFRVAEALCVFALFTPAAIPGLTAGCLLYNLTNVGVLPLDILMGTAASALAAAAMWLTRKWKLFGYPLFAMLMPTLINALLVGWELTLYFGGGFFLNALYVAIGEAGVLLTLGSCVYYAIKARKLDSRLF